MTDDKQIRLSIMTPKFRISFPHVFKAKAFKERKPMFSIQMLFPKDTNLDDMKALCAEAAKRRWGKDIPEGLKSPFKDGDKKKYDNSKGMIIVEAKSEYRPGVVDQNLQPIIDPSEFQPGYWARATISPNAYDVNGNRGVSFWLQNLQLVEKDKPFTGRKDAQDEFEVIEDFEMSSQSSEEIEDLASMF